MRQANIGFTDKDLEFLIDAAAPGAKDREQLKRAILEDDAIRRAFTADERVLGRLLADDQAFVRISPSLYFEILLRKTRQELQKATYTLEPSRTQKIVVFDAAKVISVLDQPDLIEYLADMLASFTKVETRTVVQRRPGGGLRRIRFSDTDIDNLTLYSRVVDEDHRLPYYKRIADLCLFILGIFPEFAISGIGVRNRRRASDYEEEGRRFYKLASGLSSAKEQGMAHVFETLHERLYEAEKPLNLISNRYLTLGKQRLFPLVT